MKAVCHIIDNMGVGGAQTMMSELVNGFFKYRPDITTRVVVLNKEGVVNPYSLSLDFCNRDNLARFLEDNQIGIVVQHRTNDSSCIKKWLPSSVKYVLVNHTWNNIDRMARFKRCDHYISVCKFLDDHTEWKVNASQRSMVLNGLENENIGTILPAKLDGKLKIGRCHRLLGNKFSVESLKWVGYYMPKDLVYYIVGENDEAKQLAKRYPNIRYLGPITDYEKKISIIKGFDIYFYETFGNEGASMAVLESLACGVPVLCSPFGGNGELITHNVNGLLLKTKQEYQEMLRYMYNLPALVQAFKDRSKEDFASRLHIKHVVEKYADIFETVTE